MSILEKITSSPSECAEHITDKYSCLSKKIQKELTSFLQKKETLGCDSESCVITHPAVKAYAQQKGLDLSKELETRFKAPGPRNNTGLLTNFNIDETLQRWAIKYTKFFNCPFSMMDFERIHYKFNQVDMVKVYKGEELQYVEGKAVKRPCNTFGCVLNTDFSTGTGKHWVAIFVDMRGDCWSIEYFNSAGNSPPGPVIRWMERVKQQLLKIHHTVKTLAVTNIRHQRSQTECGPYSLFYIRARLDNVSYTHFISTRITDEDMYKFRTHLFRIA
ncbi:BA71V-S273R (i6R) [African swine fever virus]|uniref:BA71V-S273R (I6R) n=1 Tax=African swine fever virus TaxID=10497 RepID=A0A0C5AWU8_ASF|nr:BA71V-S273R (i6R) [African swine fever virus]AJL34289.1 BA71V-S273R (i6R) [African swine fever virus]WEG42158.1 BA71V-S273R (i6R) [African swine fever virus]